jgi:hypothetical protein
VLAFASALLVLFGTLYAMAFSALLSLARGPHSGMSTWSALPQVALAGLLLAGGVRILARDRRWLLGAAAGQLALSGCWLVVLEQVAPPTVGGAVLGLPLFYALLAVVSGGLTFLPDARSWTARPAVPAPLSGA